MTRFAEYDQYDALGLAHLVREGAVSADELLEEAIARAEAANPHLNAIVTPLYDLARESLGHLPEGPFSGVPFLLKDLLQACAGVPMSSGTGALRDYRPPVDSVVVARFKAAGLNIFGKTNVPELGLVAVTEPKAFGPTRNPWNREHSPGGSSGGSAASVAAGIVPIASANDGGGSIRIPAGWCGLFGLKPSRGRVSVGPYYGEIWEGAVADNVISRSVRDSAAALDAIAGPAPGDPVRFAPPERPFLEECERDPGRLRIAYDVRSPLGLPVHPECVRAVEDAARLLSDLGHQVEEAQAPVDGVAVARAYLLLFFAHVAADLRWIRREVGERRYRDGIEEVTRLVGLLGDTISGADFVESKRSWNVFARSMGSFHERYELYLTPTAATPPVRVGSLAPSAAEQLAILVANRSRAGRLLRWSGVPERLAFEQLGPVPFTQLANLTGQPAMSVPLHWTEDGLPCGVQFMAAVGNEGLLYRLAAQLEQARPWWDKRPPDLVGPA